LPVWPICDWWGYQLASTAARDAPTAAPSESASASTTEKLSAEPTPRPQATTIAASVSSGRSPFSSTTRPTSLLEPRSDEHRRRITDRSGQGEQIQGDLLGLPVGVLDEYKNLRHLRSSPVGGAR
jgi:hypothetical protein